MATDELMEFLRGTIHVDENEFLRGTIHVDENGDLDIDTDGVDQEADRVLDDSELRVRIAHHSVHRHDHPGELTEKYVVSKGRWFVLKLELVGSRGQLAVMNALTVECGVLFENGEEVPLPAHEQPLHGATTLSFMNGKGEYKLAMGPSVLSNHFNNRKFVLRIWPADEALRLAYKKLTLYSTPMHVMTKLYRKSRAGGDGTGAAGTGAAGGQLTVNFDALQGQLDEERDARLLLEHELHSVRVDRERVEASLRDELLEQRQMIQRQQELVSQLLARLDLGSNSPSHAGSTAPAACGSRGSFQPQPLPQTPTLTRSRSPRHDDRAGWPSLPSDRPNATVHRGPTARA